MLAEARTLKEVKQAMGYAWLLRQCARKAQLGLEIQNAAAAIYIEAQAKAGELLSQMTEAGQRHPQGRTSEVAAGNFTGATLAELEIGRTEAHRWGQVASVPAEVRADYIEEAGARCGEVSRSGLLAYAATRRTVEPEPEAAPALVAAPWVKSGQLYLLGAHRLLCGDATDLASVERLTGGEAAECLWTDPPYGVAYVGKTKQALTIENDSGDKGPAVFAAACRIAPLAPCAPFYVTVPAGPRQLDFLLAIRGLGWHLHQELVWVKNTIVLGHSDYHYAHEPILYGYLPGPGRPGRGAHEGTRWYGGNNASSVLAYDRPARSEQHPTMKPVGLVAECLANSTKIGDLVYEPFAGSGSTLIACEQLRRRCYAMEVDPRYAQVTIERWQSLPGRKAVRA